MGKTSDLTIRILGEYSNKAIAKAEADLRKLSVETAKHAGGMAQSVTEAGQTWIGLGGQMAYAGQKVEAVGTKITKATAPIAAVGTAAAKLASDYEDAVAKVYTIMDKSAVSTERMSRDILDLSTATGKSATELAEATYQALSASVATEKAVPFVEQSVKLAKAGFTETATAVDTLTTVINAYGMSADDAEMISNRLVQTQNKGKTTVNELAGSMGNVIPTAAAYNVSLDNLCSAYVQMTKQGINTANATTAINGMLTELADEGSTVAGVLKEQTGKSFSELMADGKNLGEVLEVLKGSVDGDTTAFANLWGNVRASKGALAIANAGAEDFTRAMGDMAESAGLVDSALEDLATPSAKANKAMNALKNTGIELGEAVLGAAVPSLEEAARGAQGLYKRFGELDDGAKQSIVRFGALAVATGPVVTLLGKGMQAMGGFVTSVGKGMQSVGAFSASVKAAHAELKAANAGVSSFSTKAQAMTTAIGQSSKAANVLKGALASVGFAAAIAAFATIAAEVGRFAEHVKLVERATGGMDDALARASASFDGSVASIDGSAQALGRHKASAEDALRAQADLADKMAEAFDEYATDAATVSHYADVIAELGGKGSLTAEEQARLTDAVSKFNEMTGGSIGIVNAQTGELNTAKEAIYGVAEAWREEARAQAARELYADATKNLVEQEVALKQAEEELAEAEARYNADLESNINGVSTYSYEVDQLREKVAELTASHDAAQRAVDGLEGVMVQGAASFETFEDAVQSVGLSMDDMARLAGDALGSMEAGFDGSLNSIVQACASQGVRIPEELANGIMRNSGLPEAKQRSMLDALVLQMTGGDVAAAAQALGHDIDDGLRAGIEGGAEMPAAAAGLMSEDVIERAREAFQSHSPSQVMIALGGDIDSGLAQGIDEGGEAPVASMEALGGLVQAAVEGLPDWMSALGSDSGQGMSSGLDSQGGAVTSSATSLYSNAQRGVTPVQNALGAIGRSAGGKLAGALASYAGQARGAGGTLSQSAQAGLNPVVGAFGSTGRNAAGQFSGAIGSASAYGQGSALASSADSGLRSVSAYGAGSNFTSGFTSGMGSVNVFSAAYSIGQRALGAIKSALGIASPSKEAMKVGEFFGEGAVIGMRSTERALEAQAARMSEAMSLEPSAGGAWAVPGQSHAASSMEPELKIVVNVYPSDRYEAVQAGTDVAEAIGQQLRRYKRARAYAS